MDYKLLIALYAALLATFTFIWKLYEFYYDRKGKLKITHEFYSNFLIGNSMFTTICAFTITNISSNKRIINSIGYIFNNSDDTIYSPLLRFNKPPVSIDFGETITYDIYYSDFDNLIDEIDATKLRLIVMDSTGKKYKTKWIRIKRFPKSSGHTSEMILNDKFSAVR